MPSNGGESMENIVIIVMDLKGMLGMKIFPESLSALKSPTWHNRVGGFKFSKLYSQAKVHAEAREKPIYTFFFEIYD